MLLVKYMFVSDFLLCFSNNNDDEEAIKFVTNTNCMAVLDNKCRFDYTSNSGLCTEYSFPVRCGQTKYQNIQMLSLSSNHPEKTKSRAGPTIKSISVLKPALVSTSSSKVNQPLCTTQVIQPLVMQ